METFTKDCVDAYEKTSKIVGAYFGWAEKMIDNLRSRVNDAPLGLWKRRAINSAIRKMEKEFKKQEAEFLPLVAELGKLSATLDEVLFIENCARVRRMVLPLFAKARFYYGEVNKIIAIVSFTTKKGA